MMHDPVMQLVDAAGDAEEGREDQTRNCVPKGVLCAGTSPELKLPATPASILKSPIMDFSAHLQSRQLDMVNSVRYTCSEEPTMLRDVQQGDDEARKQ